jgi:hypothetical protein
MKVKKTDEYIIMLLAIIIVILIILILWIIWMRLIHPKVETKNLDELLKNNRFKTGDIILFHSLDNIYSVFIGYYTHCGIIYIDPDDPSRTPYLFEAIGPPDANANVLANEIPRNGICICKLEDRLRRYKGYVYYKQLSEPIPQLICEEFKKFIGFARNHMFYDYNFHSMVIHKFMMRNKCSINTNCGELVFLSLIRLRLLPDKTYNEKISHHLLWISRLKNLTGKYHYKDIIRILDSPF